MNVSWEEIVDYARGLASAETCQRVEANPQAMDRVSLLQRVVAAGHLEVPENFVNRAKALLPSLPEPQPLLARLIFASGAAGMRTQSLAQNLQYEFAFGRVEVRVEPNANGKELSLVGLVESDRTGAIHVFVDKHRARCNDLGEFDLVLPAAIQSFYIEFSETNELLVVNLP